MISLRLLQIALWSQDFILPPAILVGQALPPANHFTPMLHVPLAVIST